MESVINKICSVCKKLLPSEEYYPDKRMKLGLQSSCKACARQWHRDRPEYVKRKNAEYKLKNPTYAKNYQRKKNFGITENEVLKIVRKQNDVCPGCLRLLSEVKDCVDHCHVTGRIRGVLCNDCNVSIGRLKDSPDTLRRLADYLERKEAEEWL